MIGKFLFLGVDIQQTYFILWLYPEFLSVLNGP